MNAPSRLSTLLAAAVILAACSGSDNNNELPPPVVPPAPPPTTTPPPAVDAVFTTFVLALFGQTSDTALPVDINNTNFTFSEDPNAFNSVLGGP